MATLPAAVLPGSVVTLTLASDELARRVIAAARHEADPRVVLRVGADDSLVVVAQVPDVGNLPTGDPAAVISIQCRARIAAIHPSERGTTFADVQLVADPRPTPRIEALSRELRGVLGVIAELRRSRRLPELLRTASAPGALADAVATWAEFDDAQHGQRCSPRSMWGIGCNSCSTGRATMSPSCRSPSRSATT